MTLISDVSRPKKVKRQPNQFVKTANGVALDRQLVADAREQLEMQTGIWLKQPELIALMEESGIDETLAEFGEAETQIREMLADALAMKLVGRSGLCVALFVMQQISPTSVSPPNLMLLPKSWIHGSLNGIWCGQNESAKLAC